MADLDEAVKIACQEPTLLDALTWICVWESERAISQARFKLGSGSNGAGWDTCFRVCLQRVMKEYLPSAEYVQVHCTAMSCRGRRNGGQGFTAMVQRGQESHALCNECFCK